METRTESSHTNTNRERLCSPGMLYRGKNGDLGMVGGGR